MNKTTTNPTTEAKTHNCYVTVNLTELKKFLSKVGVVIVAAVIIISIIAIIKTPIEEYSSIAKNDLRIALNSRDPEAIEYYKETFISNDIYLFDGELTFELMGEKYNVSGETLMQLYEESTCESAQEFHDEYVKCAASVGLLK